MRPDGYVDLWDPDHPLARADGYIFEPGLKTHCPKGHELVEPNLYWHKGSRSCKTCAKERARQHELRKRQAA